MIKIDICVKGIDFGYLGKPYDTATGLYNYGYRDYSPTVDCEFLQSKILVKRTDRFSTFTTVDPIKDGSNWFVYVNTSFAKHKLGKQIEDLRQDPINYVDLWGLCKSSSDGSRKLTPEEIALHQAAGGSPVDYDKIEVVDEMPTVEDVKDAADKVGASLAGFSDSDIQDVLDKIIE